MRLTDIKPLSQKDKRWASKKLPGGETIGKVGCLLTCLAMQLGTTPDKFATKPVFRVYKGKPTNYVDWGKFVKIFPYSFQWVSSGDFEQICRDRADRGLPTIIRIKNFEHFVLCVGYDDKTKELFINDPLKGETYYLKATGYKILSLRLLTPTEEQQENKPELEKCWEAHKQAIDWANKEKAEKEKLMKKVEELQRENENLKLSLSDLKKRHQDVLAKNRELSELMGSLADETEACHSEISKLKEKIKKLEQEKEVIDGERRNYKRWYENLRNRKSFFERAVDKVLKVLDKFWRNV